ATTSLTCCGAQAGKNAAATRRPRRGRWSRCIATPALEKGTTPRKKFGRSVAGAGYGRKVNLVLAPTDIGAGPWRVMIKYSQNARQRTALAKVQPRSSARVRPTL